MISLLNRPSAIVFDCDGVLLDTVEAKLRAFREWVPNAYVQLRDDFCAYNRKAFGASRFVQIRHFYSDLVKVELSDDQLKLEAHRFGEICDRLCADAAWLPGSLEFVRYAHSQEIPLFVLSGTPETALNLEFSKRDARHFFRRVIGAPTSKVDGLRAIIEEVRPLTAASVWMLGDGRVDRDAAETVGASFVFKPSALGPLPIQPRVTVENLFDLTDILRP